MQAAIIGGRLQGLEACYLARKAGWSTLVIDKDIDTPAQGLCDSFLQLDIASWKGHVSDVRGVDIIIPATENRRALQAIDGLSHQLGIPCIFDRSAYSISSSKHRSYALLDEIGIPVPQKWPECGFPLIIKPDGQSGSKQVQVHTELSEQLIHKLNQDSWVAEKYITGQLYSLEVVGVPGNYETILVTDLIIDPAFDCKRVIAPSGLESRIVDEFHAQARQIAEAVQLHGVMDVEAILHQGRLITIEIDARLPSQTPTAVYWSCNCNILEQFAGFLFPGFKNMEQTFQSNHVVYEHIAVKNGSVLFCGEGSLAGRKKMRLLEDFYGADEAITDIYHAHSDDWGATLIFAGPSLDEVQRKRAQFYSNIQAAFSLSREWESNVFQ